MKLSKKCFVFIISAVSVACIIRTHAAPNSFMIRRIDSKMVQDRPRTRVMKSISALISLRDSIQTKVSTYKEFTPYIHLLPRTIGDRKIYLGMLLTQDEIPNVSLRGKNSDFASNLFKYFENRFSKDQIHQQLIGQLKNLPFEKLNQLKPKESNEHRWNENQLAKLIPEDVQLRDAWLARIDIERLELNGDETRREVAQALMNVGLNDNEKTALLADFKRLTVMRQITQEQKKERAKLVKESAQSTNVKSFLAQLPIGSGARVTAMRRLLKRIYTRSDDTGIEKQMNEFDFTLNHSEFYHSAIETLESQLGIDKANKLLNEILSE